MADNTNGNKLVNLDDLNAVYNSLYYSVLSLSATIRDTVKRKQTAVGDPTENGNAVSFIDSITQDANGVISATKKTIPDATTSASGLMTATDKTNLENTVPKTGGTFTGGLSITGATTGLTVNYAGDTAIKVNDTGRGHSIELRSWSDRKQGLWTPGYASDSAYNSSEKWLIYRDKDGKVHVGDHYSAEEIDTRLSNLRFMRVTVVTDNNNNPIVIPASTTSNPIQVVDIYLQKYIGEGLRVFDAVSAWLGDYRLPYITNDGIIKTWIASIVNTSDAGPRLTIHNMNGEWQLSRYRLFLTLLVY